VNLTGSVEIETGDGTKRVLGPGDILLAEDTTGRGHISRAVRGAPRTSRFIPRELPGGVQADLRSEAQAGNVARGVRPLLDDRARREGEARARDRPLRDQPGARSLGQRARAGLRRVRGGLVRVRGGHAPDIGPRADVPRWARSPEIAVVLADEKNLFDLSTRFSVIVQEHVMVGAE
jgi:hypothetical protein